MIRLDDTSGSAVASAIAAERHRQGSPMTGMVLTMLILSGEDFHSEATAAAVAAAREHPMRIITLIPKPGRDRPTLDAEIAVGGDDGPGEVAVLRLRGELSQHASSVAIPLLLSDTPVVAYWPSVAPEEPSNDPIGRHAQRRITDAAASRDPISSLIARARSYQPGDSDLAWTRITPWRTALAALFDRPMATVNSVSITADRLNPSAALLRTWLAKSLKCEVSLVDAHQAGISGVTLNLEQGELSIERVNNAQAILRKTGSPDARITLPRRDLASLLSEDLKRLDPDETYGWVIREFGIEYGTLPQ
jgi:glucose-6-phosphate dehydrogenase assembly protein OpcA